MIAYSKELCSINELKERIEKALSFYFIEPNAFSKADDNNTEVFLSKYPEAYKLYISAKEKYSQGIYDRNVLDDLRLSLELLMKSVLKNNKPLEKQKDSLGNYLKENGYSKEVSNLFVKILKYYTLYQNKHVKHDDRINKNDITTIIDLTTLIMEKIQK